MLLKKLFILLSILFYNNSYKIKHIKKSSCNLFMKKDKSKDIFENNISNKNLYLPKTTNQIKYVNLLDDNDTKIIIINGPAGTGKTLFACIKAIKLLNNNEIDRIIITRPAVAVEEEIGYLPGSLIKKMDPWTKPIFDLFLEYYSKSELDKLINSNIIEISPLGFMRGRTFKNCYIIADEMQNSSPNQMKMLVTRIGINSRMVITGDLQQSDLNNNNGLFDITTKIKNYNDINLKIIQMITFSDNDIQRSFVVSKIIEIYNNKDTKYIRVPKMIDFDLFYKKKI